MMPPKSPSGRLHLLLQPTQEEVFEPDAVSDPPLIRFIAYGRHHQVFGWVRLRADRLTDLLNAYGELHLADAEFESFDDGMGRSVDDIIIHRRELVAVHATGPRGDSALRQDTESHPIAVQSGNYRIGGHLHTDPGADPISTIGDRPAMLPLTEAWIEYWSGGERRHKSTGMIIVNREEADWIRLASGEEVSAPA